MKREELLEECELAFNSAIAKAHQQYPYRKKRIEQAKEEIVAFIKKEVTEEWIGEKVKRLYEIVEVVGSSSKQWIEHDKAEYIHEFKDFIRSLVKEIHRNN